MTLERRHGADDVWRLAQNARCLARMRILLESGSTIDSRHKEFAMNIRTVLLLLLFLPVIILGGILLAKLPMNAAFVAILGAVMIYLAYKLYAPHRSRRDTA
jgi:uncharacterized membrane protein YfcA